ncbi:uncharacterized protein LOC134179793 isoform X2 [Corticium candelabrum]|uniref:uncharacterized protein LOC134179793 isoform X2 n=1 Tax=Corticium candelabrum TaxID=121492 RepID=UPI002E257647|nr:uncharacterized protein LOC134179793 isoform X2 [Corticium candelabrum]
MDIYWRDACICPIEDDYKRMVKQKTGGLFKLAVELMQLFSENKRLAQMQMKVFRPIDERDVIMRLHLSLCATTTTKRLSREAAQRTRRLHSCELENSQIGDLEIDDYD